MYEKTFGPLKFETGGPDFFFPLFHHNENIKI